MLEVSIQILVQFQAVSQPTVIGHPPIGPVLSGLGFGWEDRGGFRVDSTEDRGRFRVDLTEGGSGLILQRTEGR